jgi:hypothetical protein
LLLFFLFNSWSPFWRNVEENYLLFGIPSIIVNNSNVVDGMDQTDNAVDEVAVIMAIDDNIKSQSNYTQNNRNNFTNNNNNDNNNNNNNGDDDDEDDNDEMYYHDDDIINDVNNYDYYNYLGLKGNDDINEKDNDDKKNIDEDGDDEDGDDDDNDDDFIPVSQIRSQSSRSTKQTRQLSTQLPANSKYTNRFKVSSTQPDYHQSTQESDGIDKYTQQRLRKDDSSNSSSSSSSSRAEIKKSLTTTTIAATTTTSTTIAAQKNNTKSQSKLQKSRNSVNSKHLSHDQHQQKYHSDHLSSQQNQFQQDKSQASHLQQQPQQQQRQQQQQADRLVLSPIPADNILKFTNNSKLTSPFKRTKLNQSPTDDDDNNNYIYDNNISIIDPSLTAKDFSILGTHNLPSTSSMNNNMVNNPKNSSSLNNKIDDDHDYNTRIKLSPQNSNYRTTFRNSSINNYYRYDAKNGSDQSSLEAYDEKKNGYDSVVDLTDDA